MARFVILEHDHPVLHWDLMLEADNVLETWRLAEPPTAGEIGATALPNHRLLYLDYEGPIKGDRGTVQKWDAGTYVEESGSRPDARRCFLEGARLRGQIELERIDDVQWKFNYNASR